MAFGINRVTGAKLDGFAHLEQSVHYILTTLRRSCVIDRDFGCDLPLRVDQPGNQQSIVDAFHDMADALWRDEPRFELTEIRLTDISAGHLSYGPLIGWWYYNWPDRARQRIEIAL